MTFREALHDAARRIEAARVTAPPFSMDTPYLDAVVLLAFALGVEKETIYTRLPDELPPAGARRFDALVADRCAGRPISYIRGRKEFYGRDFAVDARALVPRPETEFLVECALEIIDRADRSGSALSSVHDLGTGTGCIAITLKLERPALAVSASDLSEKAAALFERNCALHRVDIPCFRGAFFEWTRRLPARPCFDLVVSNPPYLTDAEVDALAAAHWPEPECALRGGPEGIDRIAQLIRESVGFTKVGSYLALESAPWQTERVVGLLSQAGFGATEVRDDLAGKARVTIGRLERAPLGR